MKIIVTGGRDYSGETNKFYLFFVLAKIRLLDEIIQGGATGADELAREFAKQNNIKCTTYHADWGNHGRAAGPIRNEQMLKENPDAVILAFPGGRGTADCVKKAKALKMRVIEIPVRE